MRNLLIWAFGILIACVSMASSCNPAQDIISDISAPISMNFNVTSPLKQYQGDDTLDPNTNSDYRDHKAELDYISIDDVSMQVTSFDKDVLVNSAEFLWAYPDSATFHSIGVISGKHLSEFQNAQLFPTNADNMNRMAAAIRGSAHGIKFRYRFDADSAPFNFAGKATVKLKLNLQ